MYMPKVTFSVGNSKMGDIHSISLPAIETCRSDCTCKDKCYAAKLIRFRKSMRESYERNLDVLKRELGRYWDDVNMHLKMSRFFRFHVSGDIPNKEYCSKVFDAAENNPHCEILCFTKQYEFVNDIVSAGRPAPKNLHIVFSGWPGMKMDNPYHFPEAHVRFKNGMCEARDDAKECGGNCTECAETNVGCWTLMPGEQIIFNEH